MSKCGFAVVLGIFSLAGAASLFPGGVITDPMRTLQHNDSVWSVSFTSDGKTLLSAGGEITLWDTQTWELKRSLKGVPPAAISPDGKTVAAQTEGSGVRLFDAQSGQEIRVLEGHDSGSSALAFSPDGRIVASAGGAHYDSDVLLWDIKTGALKRQLKGASGDVDSGLAFSPDGESLTSSLGYGGHMLWHVGALLALTPGT